ncbi:MAG: SMP-30/gluconolactonase/LRE family protein [Alphaproteobacteria bacterium]|nr:SMP-30/gluconolactonase/LRE family protein [Alphaproteobacteria bacterium]
MSGRTIDAHDFRPVWSGKNGCGERPVYAPGENALYWVDCNNPTMFRLDLAGGAPREWKLPSRVGTFALRADGGGAIVALTDGFYDLCFATGEVALAAHTNTSAKFFLNDGRCDLAGRFLAGVVNHDILKGDTELGRIYRYDKGAVTPLLQNVLAANGMAFSPDGLTFYNGCCGSNTVFAHDYELEIGAISNSRVFAKIDAPGCYIDGAAVDDEGGYWLTLYGAGRVLRFLPDGTLERSIQLPLSRPTMVAFGGNDFATMFVTTAADRIDPRMPEPEAGNGSLWAFDPGFRGLPEPMIK